MGYLQVSTNLRILIYFWIFPNLYTDCIGAYGQISIILRIYACIFTFTFFILMLYEIRFYWHQYSLLLFVYLSVILFLLVYMSHILLFGLIANRIFRLRYSLVLQNYNWCVRWWLVYADLGINIYCHKLIIFI